MPTHPCNPSAASTAPDPLGEVRPEGGAPAAAAPGGTQSPLQPRRCLSGAIKHAWLCQRACSTLPQRVVGNCENTLWDEIVASRTQCRTAS